MIMELGSVLLLTLVSLVSASPYGYGVKGGAGALAKAEASATAGAISGFGAVPVAFPAPIGGYSGSYSKSSSSSFAASSASASSGSFTFNGDSTGGIAGSGSSLGSFGNSESEGKAGCGSSGCPGGGLNYLGTSGNGLQSYSGANTAAGAGGVAGLPSFTTYGVSQPCLSADCTKETPYSCTGSSCISENKCSSGHCESSLPISYSTSDVGTFNPDGQSLGYNKDTSNDFYSNCAQGNCGANQKTTNYGYNNQKPICNTPDCSNINTYNSESSNFKKAFVNSNNLNIPETYLNTPNDGSGLYSVECAGSSCQKKIYQNLPSSYNVPSYTVTASDLETPKCNSENCDSEKSQGSYNPSTYYENKPQDTTKYSSETRCTSSNCAESAEDIEITKKYSATTQRPASYGCEAGNCATYPSGIKPSFTPNDKEINNCGTTNCGSRKPTYPSYKLNYSSTPFPSYSFAASGAASNAYAPSDSTSSMNLIHATGSDNYFRPTNQNKNGLPLSVSPTQPSTIVTYLVPPSETSQNIPTGNILSSPGASSSLSYIAPSASYNPSSIQPTKGNTYHNSFSHKNTYNTSPESSGSYYSPTTNTVSKETSNSAPLSNSHYSTTPSSVGHVSPSIKPSSNAPSSIGSNYTPSSGSFIPASKSPTYKLPTTSTGYTFSNTGSVATSGSNSESHTHITSQPGSLVSHKPAVYMGSFGGPPGLLQPNDYTLPQKPVSAHQRPFVQQPYSTTTTLPPSKLIEKGSSPCNSGNCEHSSGHYGHASSSSDTDAKSIAYTGGFGGSPGFLSPSSSINNQTPTLSTKPSVIHTGHADASASSNAVIYTGGFGGPPGILKPHDSNNIGSGLVDQSSPHHSKLPKGNSNTPHIDVLTGVSTQSGAPGGANIGDFIQSGSLSSSQPSTGSGRCTSGTNCGLEYDGGNINQANSPIGAFASGAALANAVAGSSSGPTYNSRHDYSSDSKHGTGCKGGCGDNHNDSGYGLSNSGSYSTGAGRDFGVAGATAKSFGSASGSGVGSYGYGGSFASSSAHASAGAGTKGGYGRR